VRCIQKIAWKPITLYLILYRMSSFETIMLIYLNLGQLDLNDRSTNNFCSHSRMEEQIPKLESFFKQCDVAREQEEGDNIENDGEYWEF